MLSFCLALKQYNQKKCPQTGGAQKRKLSLSDPRLSERQECYLVQGPSSASDHDLKLKDGLKGWGNTTLGWCCLQIKGSENHPEPQLVSLCIKAFADFSF